MSARVAAWREVPKAQLRRYLWVIAIAALAIVLVFVGKTVLERREWNEMMGDLDKPQLHFSPDFATIVTVSYGEGVRLWDASSKRLIDVLGDSSASPMPEFTSDGHRIACSYADYVMFYNVRDGSMELGPIKTEYWIYSVAVSPANDFILATGSTVVEMWNRVVPYTAHHVVADFGKEAAANDLAFSVDGTLLAAGLNNGGTKVWRLSTEALPMKFETTELFTVDSAEPVTALAFSPDGRTLAIGDETGVVRLVSTEDGRVIRQHEVPDGPLFLTFSGDSQLLAVGHNAAQENLPGGFDSYERPITEITVWQVGSGEQTWTTQLGSKALCDMAIAGDGKRITMGYCNGDVATHALP